MKTLTPAEGSVLAVCAGLPRIFKADADSEHERQASAKHLQELGLVEPQLISTRQDGLPLHGAHIVMSYRITAAGKDALIIFMNEHVEHISKLAFQDGQRQQSVKCADLVRRWRGSPAFIRGCERNLRAAPNARAMLKAECEAMAQAIHLDMKGPSQ